MSDVVVFSADFAKGVKTKNIVVPPMKANVTLVAPPPELLEAIKKDKLIIQKIMEAAKKQLDKSAADIKGAIEDFDKKFVLAGTVKEMEDKIHTFNTVCMQIATAQEGLAVSAAMAEWDKFVAKKKEWTKMKVRFACKIIVGTFGLAVAVASAAMSGGTTVAAVVGMAVKLIGIGKEIQNFAKGIEDTEKEIKKYADELTAQIKKEDPKIDWKKTAREIASMLGAPFIKGTAGLQTLLTKHTGQAGAVEAKGEAAWDEAKKLMAKIAEFDKLNKDKKKVEALGAKCTALLDKCIEINSQSSKIDKFHEDYDKILNELKALRGSTFTKGGAVVQLVKDCQLMVTLAEGVKAAATSL